MRYRLFKSMQRFLVIQYPKFMVIMVLLLSIMTNTLVSLPYITSMCALVFFNDLFYNIEKSRTILKPFLQYFLMLYALLEIFTQLVFQIPGMSNNG